MLLPQKKLETNLCDRWLEVPKWLIQTLIGGNIEDDGHCWFQGVKLYVEGHKAEADAKDAGTSLGQ